MHNILWNGILDVQTNYRKCRVLAALQDEPSISTWSTYGRSPHLPQTVASVPFTRYACGVSVANLQSADGHSCEPIVFLSGVLLIFGIVLLCVVSCAILRSIPAATVV